MVTNLQDNDCDNTNKDPHEFPINEIDQFVGAALFKDDIADDGAVGVFS